jgi:hypothetical protein
MIFQANALGHLLANEPTITNQGIAKTNYATNNGIADIIDII